MSGYCIGVATANHVTMGFAGGFMQLSHGKAAAPKRVQHGDIIAYYSPVATFGSTEKLRAFTAIGRVKVGKAYRGDIGRGFKPYRPDVTWSASEFGPTELLLDDLEFIPCKKS